MDEDVWVDEHYELPDGALAILQCKDCGYAGPADELESDHCGQPVDFLGGFVPTAEDWALINRKKETT